MISGITDDTVTRPFDRGVIGRRHSSNRSRSPLGSTGAGCSYPGTTIASHPRPSRNGRSSDSCPCTKRRGGRSFPEVVEGTRHGYRIIASHYPYAGDSQEQDRHTSHRSRWDDGIPLLHGHTHVRDHGPNGHQFHVGVDAHDFAPIPFSVIDGWIQSLPGIETRLQTAIREGLPTYPAGSRVFVG